jgi:peptidoglycan/xylan/chitin deacetylase (PgdA/CDA1 family)
MNNTLKNVLLKCGWRLPLVRAISSRQPIILMYHSIPANGDGTFIDGRVLEQHIRLLKQNFELISLDDLRKNRKLLEKICVLLTFDDGYRNHAEVVAPILRKHHVPAVFFISSRHTICEKYLWFIYFRALEKHFPGRGFYFRGKFIDMSPDQRQLNVQRLSKLLLSFNPHPSAMYQAIEEELPRLDDFINRNVLKDHYAGMTAKQVSELAADPLFSIGVHTVDHPFLTRCGHEEAFRQIQDNKTWIEQVCNQRCDIVAYPSGDYNIELLEQCCELGFTHGYAVTRMLNAYPQFELPRIGLYSTSLEMLGFKVQWGNLVRSLQLTWSSD